MHGGTNSYNFQQERATSSVGVDDLFLEDIIKEVDQNNVSYLLIVRCRQKQPA